MALPDTVIADVQVPGHNPPHKSSGGNYYAVIEENSFAGSSPARINVRKTTSPGSVAWANQDYTNRPSGSSTANTNSYSCLSSVSDGTYIHIVAIHPDDLSLQYNRFDMSSDTWDATNIAIADLSGMSAPDSEALWCSIAYRPTSNSPNSIVIAASGLADSDMGTAYQRVDLWTISSAATNATTVTGPTSLDASVTANHEFQPEMLAVGSNTHIVWTAGIVPGTSSTTYTQDIRGRTFTSSDTISTIRSTTLHSAVSVSETFSLPFVDKTKATGLALCSSSGKVVGLTKSLVSADYRTGFQFSISAGLLLTAGHVTNLANNAPGWDTSITGSTYKSLGPTHASVFQVDSGTKAGIVFSLGSNQDIRYFTTEDGNTQSDAEGYILETVNVSHISAAVLDSGKIAYLYDDGGTTKYNEYSLSSDVDVTVGTKAFTLTTNQATVTNPTDDVNVAVNSVTFSLTPNQATVVKDVGVTSGTASFTLTPQQAAVTLDTQVDANTVNFSLTPRTATVSNDVNVAVNSASFTLTTTPATITNPNQDTNVAVGVVTFTHTENAATITYDVDVPVNTETFTFTPYQASIDYGVNVLCNSASFTFTEQQATVTYDVEVLVGTESLVLTTYPASLSEDTDVSVGTVSLSLNTFPSAISYDVNVDAQAASLSLTEQTATVVYDVDVPVGTEALSLTTHQATIQTTSDVFVNVGTVSLSLTTNQAQVAADTSIDAGTVNFTLTPLSGSVSYSVNVESTSFSFALVENQATISLDRNVQVGTVSLSLTTHTATVVAESQDTNISCGTVSLSLTEQPATISNDVNVIVSSPVSFVLQEETATLALDRNVEVDVKPFVLTPTVATVSLDREVTVGVATLTLNTIPANILSGAGRVAAKINGVEIPQIA